MKPEKEKHWLLYVLACKDDTLYIGVTRNMTRRLGQHRAGTASKYTRGRRPVELIYQEACRNRSVALKKEHALKQLTRKAKEEYIHANGHKNPGKLS